MSHYLNIEERTARQVSGELKDGGNSISVAEIQIEKNIYNSILLVVSMFSMFMDPLFLYIPVINDDKKCFKLDIELAKLAMIYRSFYDFCYLIYLIFYTCTLSRQYSKKKLLFIFLINLFLILPLPQVLVILVTRKTIRARKLFLGMNFFLVHHVLKIIRLYTFFQKAKTENNLAEWAKIAFNISYLHAGNVFGATWYFFAVERQIVCWRKSCRNSTGCHNLSFYCNESSGNYTISNDFCSTNTKAQNTTTYDFGIFHDAIQSGVVGKNQSLSRIFPCFRWGLQTVSWFGQGLPFSADLLENLFVMSITISGVVLFFFLIAKIQLHVQSETVKLEERKQNLKELQQWQPFGKLPKELQQQVKEYHSQKRRETRGFDVEYLVNNLSEDLRKDIKKKLCLELLKKVGEFGGWSDASLEDLCDLAKPAFYRERSYIIREGETIDQMLFVLQGNLWTYTSRNTAESSSTDRENNTRIQSERNDFCGEKLVAWAQADATNNLPVSTSTIQARTNVEAFVLMADDLKKGLLLMIKKDRAARRIQQLWRSTRNEQTSARGTPPSPSSRLFLAVLSVAGITRRLR